MTWTQSFIAAAQLSLLCVSASGTSVRELWEESNLCSQVEKIIERKRRGHVRRSQRRLTSRTTPSCQRTPCSNIRRSPLSRTTRLCTSSVVAIWTSSVSRTPTLIACPRGASPSVFLVSVKHVVAVVFDYGLAFVGGESLPDLTSSGRYMVVSVPSARANTCWYTRHTRRCTTPPNEKRNRLFPFFPNTTMCLVILSGTSHSSWVLQSASSWMVRGV